MKDSEKPQHDLDLLRFALAESPFPDVNGRPIRIGDPVRYVLDARDRDEFSVWTPSRWGIAIGFRSGDGPTVKVNRPYVLGESDSAWGLGDEWYAAPGSLEVLT